MKILLAAIALTASPLLAQSIVIPGRFQSGPVTLDTLLQPATLFPSGKEAFIKTAAPLGFEWTSATKDSARSDRRSTSFLGLKVDETVIRFEGENPSLVTALFYGRGDRGDISQGKYEEIIKLAMTALDTLTGKKSTVRGKDGTSAVKVPGLVWQTDTAVYTLEYSFTKNTQDGVKFRPEFVRLEISKPGGKKDIVATAIAARKVFDARAQVKKEASGDVWIPTVPMVDQGQKGYCAVATAERVMRYYGVNTDQQEMAQVANSDSSFGTSSEEMYENLRKLQNRLRIRVNRLFDLDYKGFLRMVDDYNRVAKRLKEVEITAPRGFILTYGSFYKMEGKILKEAKMKDTAGYTRFTRTITDNIGAGVPLAWSVQLGLFKEGNLPQAGGGHMRLIIGINPAKNEVIFSDSWGAGHEAKRMPLDEAWTITTGLIKIEPLQGGA